MICSGCRDGRRPGVALHEPSRAHRPAHVLFLSPAAAICPGCRNEDGPAWHILTRPGLVEWRLCTKELIDLPHVIITAFRPSIGGARGALMGDGRGSWLNYGAVMKTARRGITLHEPSRAHRPAHVLFAVMKTARRGIFLPAPAWLYPCRK